MTMTIEAADTGQITEIEQFLTARALYFNDFDRLWKMLEAHRIDERNPGDGTRIDRDQAAKIMGWLQRNHGGQRAAAPARTQRRGGKPSATPGVYKKAGRVYIVRPTRTTAKLPAEQQRCLALELVGTPGKATRMTESGDEIPFDLEYRQGFVYELSQADRMSNADAEQLMVLYKHCLCGRPLKAADSVRRGMGPVCAKRYML